MKKLVILAALAIPMTPLGASAAVVCNEDGDCWRVKGKHTYKPEFRLKIYDDNWKWRDADKDRYRWRDAGPKRGYWRKGVWIEF